MPRAAKAAGRARDPRRRVEPPFIFGRKGAAADGAGRAARPSTVAAAEVEAAAASRSASRRTSAARSRCATRCSSTCIVALLAEGHILVEDYPGVGKTALARALVALDRLPVRARPVHRRPAARRHRRHQRLQPARAALRVPARPDLRQHRARRRDQPRLAEDPVRPARVHAGAPRHRRRPLARAGAPVPRLRDAEPGRVRGHLPAARGAGRPLHGPPLARLPERRRRGGDARRPRGAATACSSSSRSPTAPRCSTRQDAARRVHASQRAARLHRRAAAPHARATTAWSSAPRRAPA